ncbi:MAG: HU family DNA-binding protein [Nitrospirae bacterium]|nr:MAG: HU family DNA-binding protein [Nitrospirota bacterium]
MTKAELIEKVAKDAGLSKAAAGKAIDAATDAIKASLKKGQAVVLVGFGSFKISKRKARKGRNPRTGKEIKIAACKVPKFTAGKTLKDAVNK